MINASFLAIPALDAIFLYQILGIACKPDLCILATAHHPKFSHMPVWLPGMPGVGGCVCRGGIGVLDAVGAGKEGGGAGGNSAGAGTCKQTSTMLDVVVR